MKIQEVSINDFLCRDEKVLFLKTLDNVWELSGGRVDYGENIEDTFQRETKEEVGFKNVTIGDLINV